MKNPSARPLCRIQLIPALFLVLIAPLGLSGQATEGASFEVASVRPTAPVQPGTPVYSGPPRGGPGTPDPEHIRWTRATLRNLLMTAYGVKAYQVNGPSWLNSERYDIEVMVPIGATKEQVQAMWQSLLSERFGTSLHHEPKEFEVEDLVIVSGGHKLKESVADPVALMSPDPPKTKDHELIGPGLVNTISLAGPNGPNIHTMAKSQPLSKLTESLSNERRHPVLDKTGLTGTYDFTLDYTPDLSGSMLNGFPVQSGAGPGGSPADSVSAPPNVAAALEEQLGLRLVKSKANLDVLVIDKADKVPTPN